MAICCLCGTNDVPLSRKIYNHFRNGGRGLYRKTFYVCPQCLIHMKELGYHDLSRLRNAINREEVKLHEKLKGLFYLRTIKKFIVLFR